MLSVDQVKLKINEINGWKYATSGVRHMFNRPFWTHNSIAILIFTIQKGSVEVRHKKPNFRARNFASKPILAAQSHDSKHIICYLKYLGMRKNTFLNVTTSISPFFTPCMQVHSKIRISLLGLERILVVTIFITYTLQFFHKIEVFKFIAVY